MPYVNVKITRAKITRAQKIGLISGATHLLAEVLGKNPSNTVIVIDKIVLANWGIGGESVATRRSRAKKSAQIISEQTERAKTSRRRDG